MDDLHLILASGRLSSPPRTPTLAAAAVATPPREARELLLDEARALLAEGAALLVAGPGARSTWHAHDAEALAQALELFDAAIAMAPSLKSYAVRVLDRPSVGAWAADGGAGICARGQRGDRDDRIWALTRRTPHPHTPTVRARRGAVPPEPASGGARAVRRELRCGRRRPGALALALPGACGFGDRIF